MKISSARGVTGFIHLGTNNLPFFRVYNDKDGFKDYDLCHSSLEVTISDDTDASFYENGDNMILDHDPETLELKCQ